MESWLTDELKKEVKKVFEPRYKRKLSDDEVVEIAENLANGLETFFRFKYENANENTNRITKS